MKNKDYDAKVHTVNEESDEGSTVSLNGGCGWTLIALGIMVAIIKIASAIASGAIPPPW